MSKLPPLASLRAFEASARHLSFTKAAEELFVTQSAISRHIRQLEDWIGTPLFARGHRGLVLTVDGEKYFRDIDGVFDQLRRATKRITNPSSHERLLIHAYPTFAMYWLIPRLKRFHDVHPSIEIQVTAAVQEANLEQRQVHAIVKIGPAHFEQSQRIFPVLLTPVCTPEIRDQYLAKKDDISALNAATLLHSVSARSNWPVWLDGVSGGKDVEINAERGFWFESSAMALVAAERGLGVAISQLEFVNPYIKKGIFVAPFSQEVPTERVYHLVWPQRFAQMNALNKFRSWLQDEVNNPSQFQL